MTIMWAKSLWIINEVLSTIVVKWYRLRILVWCSSLVVVFECLLCGTCAKSFVFIWIQPRYIGVWSQFRYFVVARRFLDNGFNFLLFPCQYLINNKLAINFSIIINCLLIYNIISISYLCILLFHDLLC